jgi:hypothetical protein
MASGAGGCSVVILADDPGFGIEIHLGDVGAVLDAVLGLIVDFDLRMIGPEMAFAAVFGHARGGGAEAMASMTRGATALAAIGIDAADAAVRPRGGIEFAVSQGFHFTAMALPAAVVRSGSAFDDFTEHVIERTDELSGGGVVRLFELLHFRGVTAGAIVRRNDDGDFLAVVVERGGIAGVRLMAGVTVDATFGVRAGLPLIDDPRRRRGMAFEAGLTNRRDLWSLRGKSGSSRERKEQGRQVRFHGASRDDLRSEEGRCLTRLYTTGLQEHGLIHRSEGEESEGGERNRALRCVRDEKKETARRAD